MKIIIKQLIWLTLMVPLLLKAQSSVTGTIVDADASLPLPGVNITIQGTIRGAVTDFNGEFKIEPITKGQILEFEYLGFKTKTIVYQGQEVLKIFLEEDVSQLSEVVLIGYGSAETENVTGAVAQVSEKEFNQGAIVSADQLLTAKTPGVRITASGGQPGSGSQIRIRGGSSLNATNDPLIVVDGVPLDQRGDRGGTRNPLNAINPNDIKDFVVLKDAASTAIYGSRASNGVILITTKKGRKESPLEVAVDFKYSVSEVAKTLDLLDADEFRDFINNSDRPDRADTLGSSSTDWQDQIFQTGTGTITNVDISKGFKSTSLRASFNHSDQDGILLTDNFSRNSFNTVITQDLFNDKLKLRLNTKASEIRNRFADAAAIGDALSFDPTQPVRTINDQGEDVFFEYFGQTQSPLNPLARLLQDDNRAQSQRLITNLQAEYEIPYVEGLSLNVNLGVDYSDFRGRRFQPEGVGLTRNQIDPAFDNNLVNTFNGLNRNQLFDATLNYKKDIESIDTRIDAVVGYSFQEFFERRTSVQTFGNEPVIPTLDINRNALLSQFGRVNIEFKDKYLISGSLRRDGSSKFVGENRFGIFPGVSFGWKLHNEKFLENFTKLTQFKIRGGWGITGQQEFENSFAFQPIFQPSSNDADAQFGNRFISTLRANGSNRDLKWEETTNVNVGFDYGFFNNRISGSFDYYRKDTEDLIAEVKVASGSNTTDLFLRNAAATKNEGVEFSINADIIAKGDFNWNLAYNITYNSNEIVRLTEAAEDIRIPRADVGNGVDIQVFEPGLNPTTYLVFRQIFDENGLPIEGAYVDVDGDNDIDDNDLVPTKKAQPDVFMGLTSTMNYKDFDFSFTFRGDFGGYNYNAILSDRVNFASVTGGAGAFARNTPRQALTSIFNRRQIQSDFYLQSSDFVRLDNLSLGYTFDFEKIKVRVSATGTNLFTITDYDGLDPEVITGGNEGVDNNFYPRPRTYVFGVNVKF